MIAGIANPRNQKENILGEFFHQRLPEQIEARPKERELVAQLEKRTREVAVLNEVNSRLGQQLVSLQDKFGLSAEAVIAVLENLGEISLAFHFESGQLEYLDALLTAYDDNNLTQKRMIGKLYNQLTEMQARAESLVKDNAFLMDELQNKCRTVLEIYSNGFPEENLAGIYHKLQKEDLQTKNAYFREENNYLTKNFNQLEHKLSQLQQSATMHSKQASLHFENYKKQTQQLQEALMRAENMTKINEVLKKKFDEVTDENNALEAKKYDTETRLVRLDNDLKLARTQLNHVKRAEREVGFKSQEQISQLNQELEACQKREKQCFNKNLTLQKELQVTKQSIRKSKRDLEQCKKDFEQTLKMLETYELKISNYVKKQQSIERIAKQNRDKIENALLERDRAILKEQQLNKIIDNQSAKHKDEMKSLADSYEKIIRTQSEKITSLQETLEQEQSNHNQTQTTFKNQTEKLRREITQLRDENSKFMNSLKTSQSDELANRLKEYEQRNESLKRILEQQERTLKEDNEDKLQTIRRLESQNRETARQLEKQRSLVRDLSNQKSTIKSKLSIVTKERDSLLDQIDRIKKQYDMRVANFQSDQSIKITELEQKLSEAVKRQRNAREKAIAMLQGYDEAEQKLKYQYESRIKQLQLECETIKAKLIISLSTKKK